jgi:hypothetical protein
VNRVFDDESFPAFHISSLLYVGFKDKILRSVVYITGYKEKDRILNWVHNYNFDLIFPGTEFLQLAERMRGKAE